MKKLIVAMICMLFGFLCQAQDEQNIAIHWKKDGTISSVEFSFTAPEKDVPASADVFLKEYLKIQPGDRFVKVPIPRKTVNSSTNITTSTIWASG